MSEEDDDMEVEFFGEPKVGEYKKMPPFKSTQILIDSLTALNEAFLFGASTAQIKRECRASLDASRTRRALARRRRARRIVLFVSIVAFFAILATIFLVGGI